MARSIQLVDHAKAKGTAANRSAIEVAGRVADDTGMGVAPIGRSRERVQHAQVAGRIQLVHTAGAGAAVGSGPVEVARRVAEAKLSPQLLDRLVDFSWRIAAQLPPEEG